MISWVKISKQMNDEHNSYPKLFDELLLQDHTHAIFQQFSNNLVLWWFIILEKKLIGNQFTLQNVLYKNEIKR